MERDELLHRQQKILNNLRLLPRRILHMQSNDNVTEFVLHDLCNEGCFNLEKAAYLVDNPDFNCLKGVAGFSRAEAFCPEKVIWDDPQGFSAHMQGAAFNQKVRSFGRESFVKQGETEDQVADHIAQNLEFTNYGFYSWNMKHDNHGIFVYEKTSDDTSVDEYLSDGLYLLGFCPVY